MSKPLVSVVTPSYCTSRFIAETIESVKSQDYPCIEHLVMDGGSNDDTVDILKRYPHLVWVSEPDRGQSHALNKGFSMAKGEIFGWLNSDDTYNPGIVSRAVLYLTNNPDMDMVYSDLNIIDDQSLPIRYCASRPFDLNALLSNNYIYQPTVFFRRAVYEELGGVDETLHYSMDREYWLRIGNQFKIGYIPYYVGANLRIYPGTKTYEHPSRFVHDWLNVLDRTITDPAYRDVPLAVKNNAIEKTRVRLLVENIRKARHCREPRIAFENIYQLCLQHWQYILKYPFTRLSLR